MTVVYILHSFIKLSSAPRYVQYVSEMFLFFPTETEFQNLLTTVRYVKLFGSALNHFLRGWFLM